MEDISKNQATNHVKFAKELENVNIRTGMMHQEFVMKIILACVVMVIALKFAKVVMVQE
jgi:hypothetical protein